MLCNSIGAEKQICVNVYHPSKRRYDVDFPENQSDMGYNFPQFMSLTQGARAAADWVAYCNLKEGEHPMANLRVEHGYKESFNVKFWELDNELHRWFEAEDYAWAAVVYSRAMKAIDPSIQIGLSSYGNRPGESDYHRDIEKMLDIAGADIDFLADRADAGKTAAHMLKILNSYNKKHNTNIRYSDTEWLAYNTEQKRDAYNMSRNEKGVTKSYSFSKWMYALNLLKNFMSFQRLGDGIWFVNFNNLANTHSQSAIETPKEGAFLTASGKALQLLSNSPAKWLLHIEEYTPKSNDEYQIQAAWDMDKEKLVLYICNRTQDTKETVFDLSSLSKNFMKSKINRLIAPSPVSMNTFENQNEIKNHRKEEKSPVKNGQYKISTPPLSFTEIILE